MLHRGLSHVSPAPAKWASNFLAGKLGRGVSAEGDPMLITPALTARLHASVDAPGVFTLVTVSDEATLVFCPTEEFVMEACSFLASFLKESREGDLLEGRSSSS